MPSSLAVHVRQAVATDVEALYGLICELALYEKAPDEVLITPEILLKDGFGPNPGYFAWVAENEGVVVGMALCYIRYSTWKGNVLYLEDLYVKENFRKMGIGAALFEQAIEHAKAKGYKRISWQVLEWNTPAINFYKKYNANLDPEWINGALVLN